MHSQERINYYDIRAIKQLLIAKKVITEDEIKVAVLEATQLDFEEDKKFAAEWWKQIKIGHKILYNGYEGTVISVSTEPWQAMVIQVKKNKLVTFTYLSRSLLVDRNGGWNQLGSQ